MDLLQSALDRGHPGGDFEYPPCYYWTHRKFLTTHEVKTFIENALFSQKFPYKHWLSPLHFWQNQEKCVFPSIKNVSDVEWPCSYHQAIALVVSNNLYMHHVVLRPLDCSENGKKLLCGLSKNPFLVKNLLEFSWILTVSPSLFTKSRKMCVSFNKKCFLSRETI